MYPPVSTPRWRRRVRAESSWRTRAGSTGGGDGDGDGEVSVGRGGSGTKKEEEEEVNDEDDVVAAAFAFALKCEPMERSSSHVRVAPGQRVLGTLPRSGVAIGNAQMRGSKPPAKSTKRKEEKMNFEDRHSIINSSKSNISFVLSLLRPSPPARLLFRSQPREKRPNRSLSRKNRSIDLERRLESKRRREANFFLSRPFLLDLDLDLDLDLFPP